VFSDASARVPWATVFSGEMGQQLLYE